MVDWYTTAKFVHVMLVVLVGGVSAGSGFWIEFAAEGEQEAFVLRHVRRFHLRFVLPGLVLIPVTGVATAWVVTRQLQMLEDGDAADDGYRRLALAGIVLGGASGVVFVGIVYGMIAKPW